MKLGTLLTAISERFPEREAVVFEGRRITFRALEERANRLANALRAHGLKVGDRVALYLPNSAALIEAMAGVLKAGGVIVPISTRLTVPEVSFIFEDSRPSVVFYSAEFRDAAERGAAGLDQPLMVMVDGDPAPSHLGLEALIAHAPPGRAPPLPTAPDDCVIGYTSGTTGRPKGAVATHMNIILLNGYMNAIEFRLTEEDTIIVTTPMAHRTGMGRIANMFASGCKLVVARRFDPKETSDLIAREKVSVLGCVPTIVRLLMPEIEKRPQAFASLRLIVATGEVFPAELKSRLFAALPAAGLYSFYAQTESGFVTGLRPQEQRSHPTSMGRAIPGIEIRVADEKMKDVADGVIGEFLVRCGPPGTFATMREYFVRPEATTEIYVDGWLRTGDAGYRDADGYYYFADRVKDMVVSGGLNIYSKEVELALAEHPAVTEAAIIGVPDPEFGEAVMAFVELKPGARASAEQLIDHCRTRIASYKKPKYVAFVDQLPRTATGKVMKGELRKRAAVAAACPTAVASRG